MAVSCEHGNEPLGCVKGGEFLSGLVTINFSSRTQLHEIRIPSFPSPSFTHILTRVIFLFA